MLQGQKWIKAVLSVILCASFGFAAVHSRKLENDANAGFNFHPANLPYRKILWNDGNVVDNALQDLQNAPEVKWDGLHVGTEEESNDVVESGILLPIMCPDLHSYQIGPYDAETFLYFRSDATALIIREINLDYKKDDIDISKDGPLIDDNIIDDNSRHIYFVYNCIKSGSYEITLEIVFEEGFPLKISWEKTCGSGVRHGIDVGLSPGSDEIISDGTPTKNFSDKGILISEAEDSSTTLYFQTSLGNQLIAAPLITSSNTNVCNTLGRGELKEGGIIGPDPRNLMVFYTCIRSGTSVISVNIKVDPFIPLQFSWTKHCGGGLKNGFDILTDTPHQDIVVKNGGPVSLWKPSVHQITKPISEVSTTFQLFMSNDKSKDFGIPVISMSPGGVALPFFTGFATFGGVADASPKHLTIHYNCIKKADVVITVTIPISQYDPVEFSWVKKCGKIEPRVSKTYITANRLMTIVILVSVGLAAAYFYYRKTVLRKKGADLFPDVDSFTH